MSKQYDGNFGTFTAPANASTPPGPFQGIAKSFPYCTVTSDRSGGRRVITTHSDLSRGDPGSFYGVQNPNGSGFCYNERDVYEERNYNGKISGTEGPILEYSNAAKTGSHNGVASSRAGEHVSHAAKGNSGDPTAAGKPGRGAKKETFDTAGVQVGGGDGGYLGGGNFAVAAQEFTAKAAGNMTLGCKGTGSFSSEGTFSMGSETGCLALGGQGITLGAAKQMSMGATGIMSLYSGATCFVFSPGGVFINSTPGPTNVQTHAATGKEGTQYAGTVKLPSNVS